MAARQAAINASVNAQGSPNARNVKQPKIFRLLCEITVIKPPKFSCKPSPGIPRCTRLDYSPSMYQRIVDRTGHGVALRYELSLPRILPFCRVHSARIARTTYDYVLIGQYCWTFVRLNDIPEPSEIIVDQSRLFSLLKSAERGKLLPSFAKLWKIYKAYQL